MKKVIEDFLIDIDILIIIFWEGDKVDIGYRDMIKKLGFVEVELFVEFGYFI